MPRSELQFGFVLPQGWRWLDQIPGNTAIQQYEFSKNTAQVADSLRYNFAYAYDHLWGGSYFKYNRTKNFFECFALLSSIIANTKELKIGQIVTSNPYRNPALLAKMLSTMDVISNGRIELGIGAGWSKEEFLAYGYKFHSAAIRIEQLDEALRIIKSMWTERRSTFLGRHYSVKDAVCNPKPVQKPHPTIMVGGTGEKHLLRVAAKYADRYNHPYGSAEELKRKISLLKDHCINVGRNYDDIKLSILVRCLIRENDDEIHKEIKKWKGRNETVEQFKQRVSAIIGPPDYIISRLGEYIDLGVTHFILHFVGLNEECLRLFDSKVIRKI